MNFTEMMSDNRIISWEEAEQIMHCNSPIKSSLPPQTRPMEPDNDTDVDWSIRQLQMDDPKLKQVNLNNMKVNFFNFSLQKISQNIFLKKKKKKTFTQQMKSFNISIPSDIMYLLYN